MLDKQLHEKIERLGNSRAASTSSERRELIQTRNMLITSPVSDKQRGPEIIDLQEYARSGRGAAYVTYDSINDDSNMIVNVKKARVIHDFMTSNSRLSGFS